jgi:hypothetical protein
MSQEKENVDIPGSGNSMGQIVGEWTEGMRTTEP